MLYYLSTGVILGLSAGFAPGPLLALVVSETLEHSTWSGIKVSLAPIITDFPIIVLTLFIFSQLSEFNIILGIISLCGGSFVLYMGYKGIRIKGVQYHSEEQKPTSLTKGVLTNTLSPHPYLFWLTVGAPLMTKASSSGILSPLAFIGGFYVFLVGSKIALALIVGKTKSFLSKNLYVYIMRFLGVVLCLFSLVLFYDGLKLLSGIL